jgi:uncharacterized protein YdcH (DUF465 family)
MPVKHDLYADLSISREDLTQRRSGDPKLNKLVTHYDEIDAEVVKAESGASGDVSDDQLKKLKEKRLLAKDQIVRLLSAPS